MHRSFSHWLLFILQFSIHRRLSSSLLLIIKLHFVGNKAKGRISKRMFQESKARQNFWKTNISYPLKRTCTCAYQEVRNVCFSVIVAYFAFLKHSFWDLPFCLIIDDLSEFAFIGLFGNKINNPSDASFKDSMTCITSSTITSGVLSSTELAKSKINKDIKDINFNFKDFKDINHIK